MDELTWAQYEAIPASSYASVYFDFEKFRYRVIGDGKGRFQGTLYKDSRLGGYSIASLAGDYVELTLGMGSSAPLTQGYNTLLTATNAFMHGAIIERTILWTPPNLKTKINGQLREYSNGWVKVDGATREIDKIWVKVNNSVREI